MLLVIYGTLTLVVVPLHQHTLKYVDTPQYHVVVVHQGVDCSVCTFAAQSIDVSLSVIDGSAISVPSEKPLSTEPSKEYSSLFSKEFPRRGPPAILS